MSRPGRSARSSRHLHDPPALADIVADRLLDIDVLARLHGPDCGQGMPVVGRGDEDNIHGLVVEHRSQVLDRLRGRTPQGDELRGDFGGAVAIRITDVGDLAVRQLGEFAGMLLAADAAAYDRPGDLVVGADSWGLVRHDLRHRSRGSRSRGRGQERILQKLTSVHA